MSRLENSCLEYEKGVRMQEIKYNQLSIVKVKPNNMGDTRTTGRIPTRSEFAEANGEHIDDVRRVMEQIAAEINWRGTVHDWTKTDYEAMFYKDFCEFLEPDALGVKVEDRKPFTDKDWYKLHIRKERHHLNANPPEDVNLIDILEMIADSVCAGRARNKLGAVYPFDISDELLREAFDNTVKLIKDRVEREDDDGYTNG